MFGYHGNQLRWYNDLTRYAVRQGARTTAELEQYWLSFLNSAALRALAARYVLLPGQVELPGFRLLGADQRVAVYVNDAALPGVAVVPEVQVEPDSARRIATLWSPTFDPAKTTIVEEPVLAVGQARRHRHRGHRGQRRRYPGGTGSLHRAGAAACEPHAITDRGRRRSMEFRCR